MKRLMQTLLAAALMGGVPAHAQAPEIPFDSVPNALQLPADTYLGEVGGVATNSRGDIFVSEYTRVDRVQGFSGKEKKAMMLFGRPGSGSGEFNRAEGLGIDHQDRIYVADSCNHRIQVFARDGKWLRSYGGPGKNPGEMSHPYDVRVDADGIHGKVLTASGPWRTSGYWWTAQPWNRDEWEVALAGGALYRVYRQPDAHWFVEGSYD